MAILHDFSEKIKERGVGVFVLEILAISAFGCASFALGLYGARNVAGTPSNEIKIVYPHDPALIAKYKPSGGDEVATSQTTTAKSKPTSASDLTAAYVGSVNGTKYYPVGCSGANRIKPENQILFATMEEAEGSGYTQSTTCTY